MYQDYMKKAHQQRWERQQVLTIVQCKTVDFYFVQEKLHNQIECLLSVLASHTRLKDVT